MSDYARCPTCAGVCSSRSPCDLDSPLLSPPLHTAHPPPSALFQVQVRSTPSGRRRGPVLALVACVPACELAARARLVLPALGGGGLSSRLPGSRTLPGHRQRAWTQIEGGSLLVLCRASSLRYAAIPCYSFDYGTTSCLIHLDCQITCSQQWCDHQLSRPWFRG